MNAPPTVVVRQPGREPLHLELHDRLEIGRDCDGLLLADLQVSRRHVELRVEGGRVMVSDLGSSNGTFVGGQRMTAPVELRAGVRVQLGGTTIELVERRATSFDERATAIGTSEGDGDDDEPEDLRRTSIDTLASSAARDRWRPSRRPTIGTTTTILFSDIESSTELATSLGDHAWYDLLERHNDSMRRQLRLHGGSEIKSQGDGFMLTFPSARAAVQFAVAAQQAIDGKLQTSAGRDLRVRIGLHTGEAVADPEGDLFGRHVIIAARIANLAVGGEILISSLVFEIVSTTGDLRFGPPRTVQLKGIPGDHLVYVVEWAGEP